MRFLACLTISVVLVACHTGESGRRLATAAEPGGASSAGSDSGVMAGGPNQITITASDFSFEAPAEVRAGLTTIRLVNHGPSLHHVQLIRLGQGKTVEDLLAALKVPGPPPDWMSMAGGPNPPEPGGSTTVTVSLDAGNYAIVCFIPTPDGVPHIMKGMVRPLSVTGQSRSGATEEAADVVVKLTDYDFQLSAPLASGKQVIRVENGGAQPHEIAIVRLKPGKAPLDFAEWGEKQVGPAPGTLFGGVSGIMPGMRASVAVDLPPGDYALICFIPDMKDGKPHFAHGMAKRLKIT